MISAVFALPLPAISVLEALLQAYFSAGLAGRNIVGTFGRFQSTATFVFVCSLCAAAYGFTVGGTKPGECNDCSSSQTCLPIHHRRSMGRRKIHFPGRLHPYMEVGVERAFFFFGSVKETTLWILTDIGKTIFLPT